MTASGEAEVEEGEGWVKGADTRGAPLEGNGPGRRRGGLVDEGPWRGEDERTGGFSIIEEEKEEVVGNEEDVDEDE